MPQFNQINNNASFDQSLMSQSYIDGLGAVAERRSKERERQAKMINAVKLAMDRLGVVGNKATVNEDGVIDARFNTFDGRKTLGEETDFGYKGKHKDRGPGTFSESVLVNPGGDEALDRVAKMNAQQPIGSGGGIMPIYNTTTGTIQPAGTLVKIGVQNLQQQQQQQQPQQQPQQPPSTSDQIKSLLDTYMQTTKSDGNNTNVSWNQSNRLGFQQQYGVNKETIKNSEVTDANRDMGFAALESSAILEQAILGTSGPIAEALKNKHNTITRRDTAISTDGVTNDLTAGTFNVSSDVSIGGSVGVGQTTTINNSTNIKQPGPTTTNGTQLDLGIESGLKPDGSPYAKTISTYFDQNDNLQNPSILENVVSTGGFGANNAIFSKLKDPNNANKIKNYYQTPFFNMIDMVPDGKEIVIGGKKITKNGSNFIKELKDAIGNSYTDIVDKKQGASDVVELPDGTILGFGVQNPGGHKENTFGVQVRKLGTSFRKQSEVRTLAQKFLGGL
jgi:hypothetical protein